MKVYSGDEFGVIKLLHKNKGVQDTFGDIDPSHEILSLNKLDDDLNSLLVTEKQMLYSLDWTNKEITSSVKFDNDNQIIDSVYSNRILISANKKNEISIFDCFDKQIKTKSSFLPVDTKNKVSLSALALSNKKDLVYVLYRNHPFIIANIETKQVEFKAKNVPNDDLGLRVDMYDTCAVEMKSNDRLVYVGTAFGDVRGYDKRAQPRPIMNKKYSKGKINKVILNNEDKCIVLCDNRGYCAMIDIRKNGVVKNFRGNSGSVKDIIDVPERNCVVTGGFDRFVRFYDYKSGEDKAVYIKNKVTKVCLAEVGEIEKENEEDEEDEEGSEIDDDELLDEEGEDEDEDANEDEEDEDEDEDVDEDEDADEGAEEDEEEEEDEMPTPVKKKKQH